MGDKRSTGASSVSYRHNFLVLSKFEFQRAGVTLEIR